MAATFDILKRYGGPVKLREAAQHSTLVRDSIQAELDAIKGIHADRCVITQEYRDALKGALG